MLYTLHRFQRDTRLYPYLVYCANLYPFPLPHLRESSVLTPSFIPPAHTCPPPPQSSLTSTFNLPGQVLPITTTTSPPVPPTSSTTPRTGPESAASQYSVRTYSAFDKCRFPSAKTLPPIYLPPLRCNPTFYPTSAVASALSVATPPGLGNPPGPVPPYWDR